MLHSFKTPYKEHGTIFHSQASSLSLLAGLFKAVLRGAVRLIKLVPDHGITVRTVAISNLNNIPSAVIGAGMCYCIR
jgi:hypothetical protein